MTDLPLLQTMWFNLTYDFNEIAAYADGVKPEMAFIYNYPNATTTGNYSLTG